MKSSGAEKVPLIPLPASCAFKKGSFLLCADSRIVAADKLQNEAEYLGDILRKATGYRLPIRKNPDAKPGDIVLKIVPKKKLGKEGYRLAISTKKVEICANGNAGLFYGIQTLLQTLPACIYGGVPRAEIPWAAPCAVIEDAPRFQWRGAMLDSSRHFQPVTFIKKFIDHLAFHKLNSFHWHLVDDHGWRIEIKKYPKLTDVGAWRKETSWGDPRANAGGDHSPHCGFYTQEEIREIVAYAASRHINVVPEIEMPGHSQAALAAYPEFGCWDGPVEVATNWGILDHNVYSPFEKTFEFLQDVLTEVMDLFPSPFIHIGGDEVKKEPWLGNPKVVGRMKEIGAEDGEALQSYFIKRIDSFLTSKGRRLLGWDEILEGGLAEGAAVMSWRGMAGGVRAAQEGHDVVMAPTTHTYLDYYQSPSFKDEPLAIGNGVLKLETCYAFEPVAKNLSRTEASHILGVQGQLWAEFLATTAQVEYMAFPRLCALAEVCWSPNKHRRFAEFKKRLRSHLKRLDQLGTRYRPLD